MQVLPGYLSFPMRSSLDFSRWPIFFVLLFVTNSIISHPYYISYLLVFTPIVGISLGFCARYSVFVSLGFALQELICLSSFISSFGLAVAISYAFHLYPLHL